MNYLVTGQNGYLMKYIIPKLRGNITAYDGDVRDKKVYQGIDVVVHFASPSQEKEFRDLKKTATTIVEGTLNLLAIAKENNAHFVYASSQATSSIENSYGLYKSSMESFIKDTYDKHTLLKIPRVYGKDRTKGLIADIKKGLVPEEDMNKKITYIHINDFLDYTIPLLLKQGTVDYKKCNYQCHSIREIKEKFCL